MPSDILSCPPKGLISATSFDAAAAEHVRLGAEAQAARTKASQLEDSRGAAVELDMRKLANAKRAKKPDPGQVNTVKADTAIVAARREADAAELLVRDTRQELIDLVSGDVDSITANLDARATASREKLRHLIDQVRGEHRELTRVLGAKNWARNPERRFAVASITGRSGLLAQNGEPITASALIDGFAQAIDPPPAPATNAHQGQTQPLAARPAAW